MKFRKALLILPVLVIAAVAGVYYLLSNLDGIVLRAVEDTGSRVAGTEVTLDGVDIDLVAGRATLQGLVVGNPDGYDSDHAFSLETVTVDLEPKSLAGNVILIDDIRIEGARLVAEQKGAASNLSEILRNVNAATGGDDAQPAGEPVDVRLAVSRFAFTDTQATLRLQNYGENSLRVPDVVRRDIGDPDTGLAPAELARRLLSAVLEEAQKAVVSNVSDRARDAATDAAKEKLRDALDLGEGDLDSAGGALKSLLRNDR